MAKSDIVLKVVTQGVQKANQQMEKLGGIAGKLGGVAKRTGQALAVALAGGVALATKKFIDFDNAMTQSVAIMDVTIAQQEKMAQTAREVATSTTISATESAEAFFFLASAGLSAEQSISALPQVAKFAQAGMFDMALATDLATDAQSALGLSVDDAQQNLENLTRVTDVLVKANTLANASVQQFSEALTNKAGASLKVTNKSIEEGVAVLSAFADRGVKGAEAGEKLNQLLRDIPRAVAKNKDEFEKLNLNLFTADGTMKNVADVVEELDSVLGGMSDELKASTLDQLGLNRGVADAVKILSGAGNEIRNYQKELENSAGTTDLVAEKQKESLQAQLEITSSKFEDLGLTIIERFTPAMSKALEKAGEFADFLNEKFNFETEEKNFEELSKDVVGLGNAFAISSGLGGNFITTQGLINSEIERNKVAQLTREQEELAKAEEETNRQQAFQKLIMQDLQREADALGISVDELDTHHANFTNTLNDNTGAIEDNEQALKDAEKMRDKALGSLQRVISAERELNAIFERQEELTKALEDAREDLAGEDKKLTKLEEKLVKENENLEKAKAEVVKQQKLATDVTNREQLAILRQEKAVSDLKQEIDELTASEQDATIQKLELAIAEEELDKVKQASTGSTRELAEAERNVANIEQDILRINNDIIQQKERIKKATDEVTEAEKERNKALEQNAENLIEVALAQKELNDAIEDVSKLGTFEEALSQMVKNAGGDIATLREELNILFGMLNQTATGEMFTDASQSQSNSNTNTGAQSGSVKTDPLGNQAGTTAPTPARNTVSGIVGVDSFNQAFRGGGIVNNNNIVLNVGGALSTSDEISKEVANAIFKAQKMGIKTLI